MKLIFGNFGSAGGSKPPREWREGAGNGEPVTAIETRLRQKPFNTAHEESRTQGDAVNMKMRKEFSDALASISQKGLTEEFGGLLAIPEKCTLKAEGRVVEISDVDEAKPPPGMGMIGAFANGKPLPSENFSYYLSAYSTGSNWYACIVDVSRKIAVRVRLGKLETRNDSLGWEDVASSLKKALEIAEGLKKKGKEFDFVRTSLGSVRIQSNGELLEV